MIEPYNTKYFNSIHYIYKENLNGDEKGIFVDCGGFDGCSAIKFMTINPEFDCVTFEPNSDLWKFYDIVPTTLIKAAVYNKNEKRELILDDVNQVGSTLIASKNMKAMLTTNCRRSLVQCIRLSDFISTLSKTYSKIILKLDVEGAEYDILDDLILTGQARNISKLYAEFHWHKCMSDEKFTEYRHEILIHKMIDIFPVCDWDASRLEVSNRSKRRLENRKAFIADTFANIEKYQNLNFGENYE